MLFGVLTSIVIVSALAYAGYRLFGGYPPSRMPLNLLARHEAAFLDAAAEAMFPAGGAIPISGLEADLPSYVDRYLAALHPGKRLQIRLLLMFFEQATIFFPAPHAPGRLGFRRFSSLSIEQRLAALEGWSDSRFFLRRLIFTALRAVLTMGYLGHPIALRHLRLAPYAFESPVLEADLLYPRIGEHPDRIPYTREDVTPPSDGTPIDVAGPWRADYAEKRL